MRFDLTPSTFLETPFYASHRQMTRWLTNLPSGLHLLVSRKRVRIKPELRPAGRVRRARYSAAQDVSAAPGAPDLSLPAARSADHVGADHVWCTQIAHYIPLSIRGFHLPRPRRRRATGDELARC